MFVFLRFSWVSDGFMEFLIKFQSILNQFHQHPTHFHQKLICCCNYVSYFRQFQLSKKQFFITGYLIGLTRINNSLENPNNCMTVFEYLYKLIASKMEADHHTDFIKLLWQQQAKNLDKQSNGKCYHNQIVIIGRLDGTASLFLTLQRSVRADKKQNSLQTTVDFQNH